MRSAATSSAGAGRPAAPQTAWASRSAAAIPVMDPIRRTRAPRSSPPGNGTSAAPISRNPCRIAPRSGSALASSTAVTRTTCRQRAASRSAKRALGESPCEKTTSASSAAPGGGAAASSPVGTKRASNAAYSDSSAASRRACASELPRPDTRMRRSVRGSNGRRSAGCPSASRSAPGTRASRSPSRPRLTAASRGRACARSSPRSRPRSRRAARRTGGGGRACWCSGRTPDSGCTP